MIARASLLALLAAVPLNGQAIPAWSMLNVPSGVRTANISQIGKMLAYRDGTTIRVFSSLTRRWESVSVSPSAKLRLANDLLLITDGNRYSAFSSHAGKFANIVLKAGAVVLNPTGQRNDSILLVLDGSDLWAFSGFVGQWVRRTVSLRATFAVRRHVAVVVDGKQLLGMSAFRGRWQSAPVANPVLTLAADGTVGIATTKDKVHGFSALRDSWSNAPALGVRAKMRLDHDLAVFWDGISYLGFSGLRGGFGTLVTGTALAVVASGQVAVAHDQKRLWFFSAPLATWTAVTLPSKPQLVLRTNLALMVEPGKVHAFSAFTGKVATMTAQTWTASSAVAAVLDSSSKQGALFSSLTGTWTALPRRAKNTLPILASAGALVPTTTGYAAWSARTGHFVDVATGGTTTVYVGADSAILAVKDGNRLRIFESRREAWLSTAIRGPLSLQFWRTTLVAFDGTKAIGFGSFHGRIETVALSGPLQELLSNSESGRVVSRNHLAAFSPMPTLSTPWQFPEFRRTFVSGAVLDLYLSAPAIGQAYLAMGVSKPFTLPGLGELFLDATRLYPVSIPLDAQNGAARFSALVPEIPGSKGIELFMQALVLPRAGRPYLTDLASVWLY